MSATILIVDDEETARSFVSEALHDAGYETTQAGDLAQAGRSLDAAEADIVLLDVNLPDGSGLSLLDRIARENPSPPVIMITAYGDPETQRKAIEGGAQGLLTKPIDFGLLREEIDTRLQQAG